MMILFLAGVTVAYWQEAAGNPILHHLGVAGGNMEGKEVRFGIAASALFAVVTTAASCGAVNAMHDSFTALGGMIPLFNMQLGEVVVGGVGAGIYGFLLFAILAVFVAGLMVGRTPEYVGKKIEAREVKLAVLAIAVLPLHHPRRSPRSPSVLPAGLAGPLNKGPHGFSEILYAFTSAVGEQRLGLRGPDRRHALLQRRCSASRCGSGASSCIVPMLAIAGSLAAKKYTPPSSGSFPTTGAALGRPAGRHHPDPGWPHLPAEPRARPDRRSSRDDQRPALLIRTSRHEHASAPTSIFTASLIVPAIGDAFNKLDPRQLISNPVMFTTAVVATLLTVLLVIGGEPLPFGFQIQLIVWLWLTVLFGTFAEALAEGRGSAQAASLRATKADLKAKRLLGVGDTYEVVPASALEKGDLVLVETGDLIPADGEVVEGVASVNEAAITGESAPVIREAGGDRSAVTAGTRVISDQIKVRVTAGAGPGLPRPHDRAGRRRRAPEDAERDRADDPARRPHDHLPDRGRRPFRASPAMRAAAFRSRSSRRC